MSKHLEHCDIIPVLEQLGMVRGKAALNGFNYGPSVTVDSTRIMYVPHLVVSPSKYSRTLAKWFFRDALDLLPRRRKLEGVLRTRFLDVSWKEWLPALREATELHRKAAPPVVQHLVRMGVHWVQDVYPAPQYSGAAGTVVWSPPLPPAEQAAYAAARDAQAGGAR